MTATCPDGHTSATDDYCDTCGVPINAASEAPAPPPPAPEAPPEPAAVTCPGCGADVQGQFCESCGYDVVAGVPAAASTVTLALGADRAHWERMVGSGEPAFPDVAPTMTFELTGERRTLGRVRPGRTSDVDLQLTGPGADPAVSQHQCEFVRDPATGELVRAGHRQRQRHLDQRRRCATASGSGPRARGGRQDFRGCLDEPDGQHELASAPLVQRGG